ncbi:4Fe-4S dicluster domain-containing protein [Bartonella sp. MM73XJBT]
MHCKNCDMKDPNQNIDWSWSHSQSNEESLYLTMESLFILLR